MIKCYNESTVNGSSVVGSARVKLEQGNSDYLWDAFFIALDAHDGVVRLDWVPAHSSVDDLASGITSEADFVINHVADACAGFGADNIKVEDHHCRT